MNLHVSIVGIVDGAAEPATRLSQDAAVGRPRAKSAGRLWSGSASPPVRRSSLIWAQAARAVFPLSRRLEGALHSRQGLVANKGFKLSFWNQDAVLAGNPETVFITEGELDACALVEAGIAPMQVLSVPNGAVERRGEDRPRGYRYVEEALGAGLNRTRRFVWCGDNDAAGLSLRADMARLTRRRPISVRRLAGRLQGRQRHAPQ